MRVQLKHRDDEGAIAIIVALLSLVLIGMAAFAVDFGNAYAVKRQLSVSADASALDAARAVATAKVGTQPILGGGRGCSTWRQRGADRRTERRPGHGNVHEHRQRPQRRIHRRPGDGHLRR